MVIISVSHASNQEGMSPRCGLSQSFYLELQMHPFPIDKHPQKLFDEISSAIIDLFKEY